MNGAKSERRHIRGLDRLKPVLHALTRIRPRNVGAIINVRSESH